MAKNGIRYPNVIDFVSAKDDRCFLHIVQVDRMSDEDLFPLQEKINCYLAFALDGQFRSTYPEYAHATIVIRLQLGSDPSSLQREFFEAVRGLCEREGIGFDVEIPAHLRELERESPTPPKA